MVVESLIPIVEKTGLVNQVSHPFGEAAGGTLAEVWNAIIGDRVAAWRLVNAAAITEKLVEKCNGLGVKIDRSKIPDRYAFSWFDEATKQDEPEIQDLFAELLLQAANGNEFAADRKNIDVIGKMSPNDALIFLNKISELIVSKFNNQEDWRIMNRKYSSELQIVRGLGITNAELAIDGMIHLGLYEKFFKIDEQHLRSALNRGAISFSTPQNIEKKLEDAFKVTPHIGVTERAISLARAVRPDKFKVKTL